MEAWRMIESFIWYLGQLLHGMIKMKEMWTKLIGNKYLLI